MKKVYIVMGTDSPSFGDSTWVHAVFSDKESAEKCAEINSELDESMGYGYYVSEEEIEPSYDLNTKVVDYYSYYVGKAPLYKDIMELCDVYYELVGYLNEKGYLTNKFFEIAENDCSQTAWGTRAHIDSLKYLKEHLTESEQQEAIEEMNKPEYRWCNDEENGKRIYKGDLDIEETEEYIQVFSINSFEEAKTTALNLYKKWLDTQ